MSYVNAALGEIAGQLQKGNLVIIESTSPVGTTDDAVKLLSEKRPDLTFPHTHGEESDIRIAYCPERVLPGQIITELMNNDRIIGGMTPKCAELAKRLYHVFVRGECHIGTHNTAELVKLSENAYRDVNIAFANELSNVCDHHDIDVNRVVQFANLHPRVNILNPGPGVGGHCIPVDPWFIVAKAPEYTPLIQTARSINDNRPHQAADKILAHIKDNPNAKIACLGLAYKPNVDDLRESPALEIVSDIAKAHGQKLYVCEPHIKELPEKLSQFANIEFTDALTAINEADIIATLVNHRTFSYVDKHALDSKIVLDFCGVWHKSFV